MPDTPTSDLNDDKPTLTNSDRALIMLAALISAGMQTDEDLQKIFEWAEEAVQEAALISLVLDGKVAPSVRNGELGFALLDDDQKSRIAAELPKFLAGLPDNPRPSTTPRG